MSKHDDQFLDELKELKMNKSISPEKKDEMRLNIAKFAKKKKAQRKRKQQFIWASTAAAVVLFGVIVMSIMNQQTETVDDPNPTPADEQPVQGEDPENDPVEDPENNSEEQPEFNVEVEGPFDETIMLEGMEEPTQVMEFLITPHQISYQMDQFLGNYDINENKITHTTDTGFATVIVEVINDTQLEEFAEGLEGDQTPVDPNKNPFEGIQSHQSGEQVTGYYAYQVNDDVLYVQYEYGIEGGDGVGPRLELFIESISKME
ncbi:hypothetical protein [Piscibacillus salipiscarius]|uniref:DUF4367 domain-containing protein n=1 Tax=Piscibacillus salipiscarius TaxID=299480 RepID=A0ABW5Q7D4_9BACI|nr:hypothetical protein [Piscibacillus salipiscarius]